MERVNLSRRGWLQTTGGAVGVVGLGALSPISAALAATEKTAEATPLPDYLSWKHADSLIVHSANTVETRRSGFGNGVITPLDRLFVRNNLTPPNASITEDPDAWEVSVEGVKNPRTYTVAELKTIGVEAVPMVLQCSGNGRAFFPEKPSGTQWTVGAAGCVVFTGIPVKALIEAAGGLADGVQYMTSTGGEEMPEGIDAKTIMVERSVPIEVMENAILAWEINGEPIPVAHGGPLRTVIPGYTGVNSVKYIKKVAFTQDQSPANIQQNSYRLSPVGESGSPNRPSVWEMPVKSWVNATSDGDQQWKAGRVQISGIAFGGMTAAKEVEVSVDGGKNWEKANFVGPDLGPFAWRQFVLSTELEPGEYELVSRATNEKGDTQPEERDTNNRGYLNNSWRDHMLKVTVV